MYVRQQCIYDGTPLVDGYCPKCEPQHFEKVKELLSQSDIDKGKPRKPGEWK